MKYRLHYTLPDGTEDSIVLSGNVDEIREEFYKYIEGKNAKDFWSELCE